MRLPEHEAVDARRKDLHDPHYKLSVFSDEELQHARLVIAGCSRDVIDATELLQMTGLIGCEHDE